MTLEYTLCAVQVEWRKIKGRPGLRLSSFIRRSGGCNCFQFYLNIKSWRTTITLDSSMKILHLLHKSKWGGKALARCWKAPHWVDVPTSILCCCNKIKVKLKKKTERKSGWERLFSVSGAARHSAFSQMHIWKSGHVVGITRVSPRSSSKLALGHRRRQNASPLLQNTSILSIWSCAPLSCRFYEECFKFCLFWSSRSLALFCLLSPSVLYRSNCIIGLGLLCHLTESPLGALISDWHVVITLPDHS